MRVVVQRVSRARVSVAGELVGEIGHGFLLLVGIKNGDSDETLAWMARKCATLRVCGDDAGRMNLSIKDTGGDVLAVSQFTLYADTSRGNRPGFTDAALPEVALPLYERFCAMLATEIGRPVATGRFGADMDVELVNQGPVTIVLDR